VHSLRSLFLAVILQLKLTCGCSCALFLGGFSGGGFGESEPRSVDSTLDTVEIFNNIVVSDC